MTPNLRSGASLFSVQPFYVKVLLLIVVGLIMNVLPSLFVWLGCKLWGPDLTFTESYGVSLVFSALVNRWPLTTIDVATGE